MARVSRQKNYWQSHPKFQILAFVVGYGREGYRCLCEIGLFFFKGNIIKLGQNGYIRGSKPTKVKLDLRVE